VKCRNSDDAAGAVPGASRDCNDTLASCHVDPDGPQLIPAPVGVPFAWQDAQPK
jgi:hypothetical protein